MLPDANDAQTPPEESQARKERKFGVTDTNAKKGPRTHDIITEMDDEGEVVTMASYALNRTEPTFMPESHALQFLKDKAFVVVDDKGHRIEPLIAPTAEELGGLVLKDDETVANLSELSKEALYKRCKVHAMAEEIKPTATKKEEMIAFLVAMKARKREQVGISRGSEDAAPDMTADSDLTQLLDLSPKVPIRKGPIRNLSQLTSGQ